MRKAIAAITGIVLALVLLTALLITGFYLLVNAATLALVPLVGKPGAMAVTGLVCLCLLALFFYRMTRPTPSRQRGQGGTPTTGSPVEALRLLIARNPLEAAALAFAAGVAEQSDPRLKKLLLQGGMVLMRQTPGSATPEASGPEDAPAQSETKAPVE